MKKNDFTKLTRSGISLIVLIITIIVIIILSAVVVMTLNSNNPISSAREAVFKEDISNFKAELVIYKAEMKMRKEKPEELNANRETSPHIQEVIVSMTDKYTKILEVKNGKLVYVGKNKKEYMLAYEMGLLPEDELLNDEILEELQPFITEWTVIDNDSITLPVGGTCNFTVDYGDGSGEYKVTSQTDEDITHTYEKAGTYTVTIKGKCTSFSAGNSISKDKLTGIVQWGNIEADTYNFFNCSNLTGTIPEPTKNSFANCTNIYGLFSNTKIIGEIPENLFYNCPKITKYEYIFNNCTGITGSIPENLFKNCSSATSFNSAFHSSGITNIPGSLFEKCKNIKTLDSTFWGCKELKGTIPENLFKNCIYLESVRETFVHCSNLTGNIPEKLFENNLAITNFYGTFSNCIQLQGNAPELWNRTNVIDSRYCFNNCTNLSNYNEIPSSWGGGGN